MKTPERWDGAWRLHCGLLAIRHVSTGSIEAHLDQSTVDKAKLLNRTRRDRERFCSADRAG
jgi:hypothetical protein